MRKIMIVDDHRVVRVGVRQALEATGGFEVCEADSAEEAYRRYPLELPDLVVMDLNMPAMSGLEGLSRLRARYGNPRVIVFSAHEEGIYIERSRAAGARGFVKKSGDPADLIAAIDVVLAGGSAFPDAAGEPGHLSELTPREFEIFRLLSDGCCGRRIAARLHLSVKTVANHRTQIMNKLHLSNLAELTKLAIQGGVIHA